MESFFSNPIFLIALTFGIYVGAQALRRRLGYSLLNPILIAVTVLIVLLNITGIDYAAYQEGGRYIEFWLKPAVVALAVPLYRQLPTIRKRMMPLLIAELAGCLAGIVSVVVIAQVFGATREVILSMVPKAVTTPIAIEISNTIGGIPALTAGVVVATGVFGSIAGFKIVKLSRIKSPIGQGLSIGTATHAVGTSAAMERSERIGAFSSLGLILNGLLTALLAPFILPFLGF